MTDKTMTLDHLFDVLGDGEDVRISRRGRVVHVEATAASGSRHASDNVRCGPDGAGARALVVGALADARDAARDEVVAEHERRVRVSEYPDGDVHERVLTMANGAKHIAWGGGVGEMPPDHLFIRAAIALDGFIRHAEDGHPQSAALLACLMAGAFHEPLGGEPEARAELLSRTLHDPSSVLTASVYANRRALGLDEGFEP